MEEAIIHTQDLRKRYGDVEALTGLDLAIPPNMVYGLLGPNGAGKSTCVRILSTLTRPTSGTAVVAGFDVAQDPGSVRKVIGLTGQDTTLDEKLTGRENLRIFGRLSRLGVRGARKRADDLLERFGLAAAGDRLTASYSGGMRRRLDLIASLLRAPAVLFLDEPTTGLDVRSRMEIWQTVRELVVDGTTVLLTSQYLEEVDQLAASVGVIDHGHVVAEGTPAALKSQIGSHIEVVVQSEGHVANAMAVLERLTGRRPEADGSHVVVAAVHPVPTLPQIVRELDNAGALVRDVGVREPSLDDVFLAVTGKPVSPVQRAGDLEAVA
ncbi:ATP-binding cassette domain-containing protein [Micromonospora sp. S-DT3-3-22]|uniref:ATP-binding cassette domain-containing protein n=1 Tax=Micromonospora sp. S-DT3-3-22 TaxID=2755359 RepID=UPI00188EBDC4|nr:ATP-binding cassette domain-containing protein [Micromonospora sp. S-DT3-3-22]